MFWHIWFVQGASLARPQQDAVRRMRSSSTTTIPIVMAGSANPVERDLVDSLARPGGNVTGVTLYGFELTRKRVEVFKAVAPTLCASPCSVT